MGPHFLTPFCNVLKQLQRRCEVLLNYFNFELIVLLETGDKYNEDISYGKKSLHIVFIHKEKFAFIK